MKFFGTCPKKLPVAAGTGLLLALLPGCKPAGHPRAAAKPGAAAVGKVSAPASNTGVTASQFRSYFDDSKPPDNKGRDPFFPNSTRRTPKSVQPQNVDQPVHVDPVIKLQGVMGGPGRWLAAFNNNYILKEGEEADVKVPAGKVHIRVIEIGEDYAIITVEGEPGQKRLEIFHNNRSPSKP
jgi:hypothetical protein